MLELCQVLMGLVEAEILRNSRSLITSHRLRSTAKSVSKILVRGSRGSEAECR